MLIRKRVSRLPWLAAGLLVLASAPSRADTLLDFSDVPVGTLLVFSPYSSQGYVLTSTSGGFVFNSPGTGNGASQTIGDNPFYAGANGLAAFAPATITLAESTGAAFTLLSIGVARNFQWDPAPEVTLVGELAGGGTVSQTLTVTDASPPLSFQTFTLVGFTNVLSVRWDQSSQAVHQFGNIRLAGQLVPEPSTVALVALGLPLTLLLQRRLARRGRSNTA